MSSVGVPHRHKGSPNRPPGESIGYLRKIVTRDWRDKRNEKVRGLQAAAPRLTLVSRFTPHVSRFTVPVRAAAKTQSPAPRLRLCSHGTVRVVESGLCVGYPGGGSTDSSAEGPRSVESPESVMEGGSEAGRQKIACFRLSREGDQCQMLRLESLLKGHVLRRMIDPA